MMTANKESFYPKIKSNLKTLLDIPIDVNRISILNDLVDYLRSSDNQGIQLIFICTHNSRRSQFAQVWAKIASIYFNAPIRSFSGGVEITACNERTIASLKRSGFTIVKNNEENENPVYNVSYLDENESIQLFSKMYDDVVNPSKNFAAVMTCSDADTNCPFIPGAEVRIPLNYEDPKEFDNTVEESAKYDERSKQIASEMFYVFSRLNINQ